jgi:hypothetical protein
MGELRSIARLALRYSTQTGLYTLRNLVPAAELTRFKFTTLRVSTPTHILPLTLPCEVAALRLQ